MSANRTAGALALFASSSTLICCALPALFVALGAGAAFASLIAAFPFLITLSQHKIAITITAGACLAAAGVLDRKAARAPCPTDPRLAAACRRARRRSCIILIFSTALFIFATIFTYLVPLYI